MFVTQQILKPRQVTSMNTKQHNLNSAQRTNVASRMLGAMSLSSRSHQETVAFAAEGRPYPLSERCVVAQVDMGCDLGSIGRFGSTANQPGPAILA